MPFVVMVPTVMFDEEAGEYVEGFPRGVHVCDYMRDGLYEEDEIDGDAAEWSAACEAWEAVEKCCEQAERMMALQPDADRAARVLEQHKAGMVPLLHDLKAKLIRCGVRFAHEA